LFFSLLKRFQHISRLGDMRQVNLRLWRRIATRTCWYAGPESLEVSAHTLGFIKLQRTGVRLLLCNADVVENIQNCLALNFQFAR
jgi:hypothetical protein